MNSTVERIIGSVEKLAQEVNLVYSECFSLLRARVNLSTGRYCQWRETMRTGALELPLDAIGNICRRHRVKQLALFGSALGKRFGPSSDVDMLVEFKEDAEVGFIELAQLQRELSSAIGRRADLVPKGGLKPIIRESVLAEAEILYAA